MSDCYRVPASEIRILNQTIRASDLLEEFSGVFQLLDTRCHVFSGSYCRAESKPPSCRHIDMLLCHGETDGIHQVIKIHELKYKIL